MYLRGVPADYSMSAKCGLLLRITLYAFRGDAFCYFLVCFLRTLVPQMRIPPIMPKAIYEMNSFGLVIAAFLLELSVAISYAELSVWYGSYVVTFMLTLNDLVGAMRYPAIHLFLKSRLEWERTMKM